MPLNFPKNLQISDTHFTILIVELHKAKTRQLRLAWCAA